MRRRQVFFAMATAFALAAAVPASADEAQRAQAFVQAFYDWYMPLQPGRDRAKAGLALDRRPLSIDQPLRQALQADIAAQAKADEIVGLDYDPFTGAQDEAEAARAGKALCAKDSCRVPTRFRWNRRWPADGTITVVVTRRGEGWRITDILYLNAPPLSRQLRQLSHERTRR